MEETTAVWFYPGSSRQASARLRVAAGNIYIENAHNEKYCVALNRVQVSPRLANVPRRLTLPDGALISVDDNDFIDRAFGSVLARHKARVWLPRVGWLLLPLVFAAVIYTVYGRGLPSVSEYIAYRIPPQYIQSLSTELYDNLQQTDYIYPSRLSDEARARARRLFAAVAADYPAADITLSMRLHHLSWRQKATGAGNANAFALPGGEIILTDALLRRLSDEEIQTVIAHEIGHVRLRHGLRLLVQTSGTAALASFLLGDYSGLMAIPLLLVHLSYSRDFEREADCFAYDYLRRHRLSPRLLEQALMRIEGTTRAEAETNTAATPPADSTAPWNELLILLSSHPATGERGQPDKYCR